MDRQHEEVHPDRGQPTSSLLGPQSRCLESAARPSTLGWWLALLVFVATLLVVNHALVLGWRIGRWDVLHYSCPYYTLLGDATRQGQLVLWTPLSNAGCPAGFEPVVGAASPLELLCALITGGNEPGFRCYWLLVWCLGGVGILVFARHLESPPWLACAAAIGYTFSAIYMAHAQHTCFLVSMSLFPWALWRLDVAIARRAAFPAVQAGAIWGLSALGGYPGLTFASAGYAVAWALGRFLFADNTCADDDTCAKDSPRPLAGEGQGVRAPAEQVDEANGPSPTALALTLSQRARGQPQHNFATASIASTLLRKLTFLAVVLAGFFATGLAVLSPTYVGFMAESRGYTSRAVAVSRETALDNWPVPPPALTTFSSPYLSVWTAKNPQPVWRIDCSMTSVYLSPLLLVLAFSVGAPGRNERFRWFLRCVALFYLLLALGGATPIGGWFYDWVPPARYFRYAALYRCHYVLTIVLLALLAFRNRSQLPGDGSASVFWKSAAKVSLVAAVVAFMAFDAVVRRSAANPQDAFYFRVALAQLVGVWLAVAVLAIWTLLGWPVVRGRVAACCFVIIAIADAAATLVASNWTVHDYPELWRPVAAKHVASLDLTARGLDRQLSTDIEGVPWNNNLISKIPVLKSYVNMTNSFYAGYVEHPILSRSAIGSQRIWFSPHGAQVPLTSDSFRQFVAAVDRLGKPCLVLSERNERFRSPDEAISPDQSAALVKEMAALRPAESVPVKVVEYSPNRLIFEAAAPSSGWLLVTDRWAPGWQATVNDNDVDVLIGNYVFRAVPVQQGTNRIALSYRPFGHPWLLILSWTTLAVVVVATPLARPNHLPAPSAS